MPQTAVRWLFAIAGFYDLAIGLIFLFAGPQLYERTGVPQPDHWAYLHFAALMVAIFGLMFFAVAYNPVANRNLIPYGILLKLSYTSLATWYWFQGQCPTLFKPFAVIDGVMLVLFVLAYRALRPASERTG